MMSGPPSEVTLSILMPILLNSLSGWADIDTIITDSELSPAVCSSLESLGVKVLIA